MKCDSTCKYYRHCWKLNENILEEGEEYLVGEVEHSGYDRVWMVEDREEELRLVYERDLSDFFFWV